jgi:hypothetical protein
VGKLIAIIKAAENDQMSDGFSAASLTPPPGTAIPRPGLGERDSSSVAHVAVREFLESLGNVSTYDNEDVSGATGWWTVEG